MFKKGHPGNGEEAKVLVTFRKGAGEKLGTAKEFPLSQSHSFDEETGT